ncbi:hypothetical protein [Streptosporangium roseum]|uniref:hypothetical protein n=1 Tax=Streptosporangium roseum TaxID=2001 RepID=UPI001C54D6CB|nr:hypothetical protein [Streptosporangium roseum]
MKTVPVADLASYTPPLPGNSIAGVALPPILSAQLQAPYRLALQDALGEPENRVLFFIDVVVGTLLHRMGMTGEPMADVTALAEMVLPHFAGGAGPAWTCRRTGDRLRQRRRGPEPWRLPTCRGRASRRPARRSPASAAAARGPSAAAAVPLA